MCVGTEQVQVPAGPASERLAELLERRLGLELGAVNPILLRDLICGDWGKVSVLAHAVHEGK